MDFEQIVDRLYEPLYRFAHSLCQNGAEASDLTQQTFYIWATKGHQLRDKSRVKTWLFTTLYREFLGSRRRSTRFPHHELELAGSELPAVQPEVVEVADSATVLATLRQVEEAYRIPMTLFYLQQHSYREIAEILDIPMGTVMSRLSRGREHLRQLLAESSATPGERKIVPMSAPQSQPRKQP